nr:TIR domain-containing protein [Sphingomonas sp.]
AAAATPKLALQQNRYFAFLSYSHKDEAVAQWLHPALERFRVPPSIAGRLTENGVVPKRLSPIFRDRHELAAAQDLGDEIREALAASRFLIVLCSPAAAKSKWTNAEIDEFKRSRPDGCVIAAIVEGEPFASEMPGREEDECFPPALQCRYDKRGRPTTKRAEPLAADLRDDRDGRRMGLLKIVAGMLGVGLDDLVQRDQLRRQRRLARITAAALAGMIAATILALTAISARDAARDQRREAESLVQFMLGDLKDKLEPIGKLDALDGVGSRVLAYYSQQDTSELSDSGLMQRSRALSLMAEVAYARGNLDVAQRLYREAMDGTAEAIRRDPNDPQRLFDHAQNVFWTTDIARQRGQVGEAERGLREYKRIADQMVAIEPNNMKWRMEQQSADTNLGVLLLEQRRFSEATRQFSRALATIEALATADPLNGDYQKAATESQTWLASALAAEGRLQEATALREVHVAALRGLLSRTGDVEYRQKLVAAERSLGELYRVSGRVPDALKHFRAAVEHSQTLLSREPQNSRWSYFSARAEINLAQGLLAAGRNDEAAAQVASACSVAQRLIARDSNVQRWRAVQRDCRLMQARMALAAGDAQRALALAQNAVDAARSVRSTDSVDDKFSAAEAYRLVGDIRQRMGDTAGAQAAWQAGLQALPARVAEQPKEIAERAMLLQRLGQEAEAQRLQGRLAVIGYQLTRSSR